MEITTKFNVGDFVYFIDGKQNIGKAKIERIKISIDNEKYSLQNKCNEVSILYDLEGVVSSCNQDKLYKDFEDFKKLFQLKFDVLE